MEDASSGSMPGPDRFLHEVLHEGLDDWVAVAFAIPIARSLGADDYAIALDWVIDTAGSLGERGLVRFGWIDRDTGWHYFAEPAGVVLGDLRQRFVNGGPDAADFYLWLELTPQGIELAKSLEPEYQSMVEAEAHRTSAST